MIVLLLKDMTDIMQEIARMNLSADGWAEIESCDMFQTENLCGGYDALENAFCFSLYDGDKEFWFQFTLEDVQAFNNRSVLKIDLRKADA